MKYSGPIIECMMCGWRITGEPKESHDIMGNGSGWMLTECTYVCPKCRFKTTRIEEAQMTPVEAMADQLGSLLYEEKKSDSSTRKADLTV